MQVDHNPYLAYKRDTRYLLQWIIGTSNDILRSPSADGQQQDQTKPNLTGEVTVKELMAMATRIGARNTPVPSSVFNRLRAVIATRKLVAESYKNMTGSDGNRDEEMEESDASHAHFIQTLSDIFVVLGGDDCLKAPSTSGNEPGAKSDPFTLSNKFSNLNTNTTANQDPNSSEDENPSSTFKAVKQRQVRKNKGKAVLKGKKRNTNDKSTEKPLPLEAYKLIDYNENGEPTDYLLAAILLCRDWTLMRARVAKGWHDTMHHSFNTAAVAASCHAATALVRQGELAIFVDFPGCETFQNVLNALTQGKRAKPSVFVGKMCNDGFLSYGSFTKPKELANTNEQFMAHIYEHLVDFLNDYRHDRGGKPSKRMLAHLKGWDPQLDLGKASEEQRLTWRRCYTINWLYDFVNFFSSIVIEHHLRKTGKDKSQLQLEDVDWLGTGPWFENRKLFGLVEFGGRITALAMQKKHGASGTSENILPSLVFQLQCLVDSFVASRGLIYHPFRGTVFRDPDPVFSPQREIDLFLDREDKTGGRGYLNSVAYHPLMIKTVVNPSLDMHDSLVSTFNNWLGRCPFKHEEAGVPPSRCATDGSYDSLWNLSPYLCGAGLIEALEIAQYHLISFWSYNPAPTALVHLYNMLNHRSYFSQPIPLLDALVDSRHLCEGFFGGDAPSSGFIDSFDNMRARRQGNIRIKERILREANRQQDLMAYLDPANNLIFNKAGLVGDLRRACWDAERVTQASFGPYSSQLGCLRYKAGELGDFGKKVRAKAAGKSSLPCSSTTLDVHYATTTEMARQICGSGDAMLGINWLRLSQVISYVFADMTLDVYDAHKSLVRSNSRRKNAKGTKDAEGIYELLRIAVAGKNKDVLKTLADTLERNKKHLRLVKYWPSRNHMSFLWDMETKESAQEAPR